MVRDHLQVNYLEDLLRLLRKTAPPHIAHELYIIDRAPNDQDAERHVRLALEALAVLTNSQDSDQDSAQQQTCLLLSRKEVKDQDQDLSASRKEVNEITPYGEPSCANICLKSQKGSIDDRPGQDKQVHFGELSAASINQGYPSRKVVCPIVVPGLSDASETESDEDSTGSTSDDCMVPSRGQSLPDLRLFESSNNEGVFDTQQDWHSLAVIDGLSDMSNSECDPSSDETVHYTT